MKNLKIKFLLGLFALPVLLSAKGNGEINNKPKKPQQNLAAGCAPAGNLIFLEFNNVRTRVEAQGIWWIDRPNGAPDYEVPKGSNSFALFAGGLWLAGTDVNGQLKAAASLFGNGVDYYTGPLDTIGTAEITDVTCAAYDKFFEITRAEVAQFVAFKNAEANGTAAQDFPGYQVPTTILDWPGNGNTSIGEATRLAPYVNVGGDDSYEPDLGDYPFYDLAGNVDCRENRENRSISGRRPLFGDKTYFWIFNDKGNLHTETNAPSIGMEIHGQAFAFATNDEVNDMTFYNFELINRSTFTLTNTYFASYVDPDLGNPADDFVGCDVVRGLGFCYNGDDDDQSVSGQTGYGTTPAAIGIDFFEGPYQDADFINNNVGTGPNEALNGLGYFDPNSPNPDTIDDNERFGMRRFVYYNNSANNNGDPELAVHFYNYMRGIWKNGRRMRHGGDGFDINSSAVEPYLTDFMFPGTSNPLKWGLTDLAGNPVNPASTTEPSNQAWTEDNIDGNGTSNPVGDRRFLQSAGPFTLEPGNVNDITVGVVFAQAQSGGRLASVEELYQADDKAQSLFDNCFQVLSGPDAPKVDVQELDKELIFYISNFSTGNNSNEDYEERDPNIVTPDYLTARQPPVFYDDKYRFQGYQVYQLSGPGISVNDLDEDDKARLVFQTDIKDDVVDLVNYTFDKELNASIPVKMVTAANDGIQKSFSINQDLFASGDRALVNFKTYYYIAIAYGYNEFKPYLQGSAPDTLNPFKPAFDGQTVPYISSRKSGDGSAVSAFSAIPHDPTFENNGTVINSSYGDEIGITRLQGKGNGGRALQITEESIDNIFAEKAWESDTVFVNEIDYVAGQGPFSVSVIDPLNVVGGTYYMQILDEDVSGNVVVTDTAKWKIWLDGGGPADTIYSDNTIEFENTQLLLNPNWGLAITLGNGAQTGALEPESTNGFISATINYTNPENDWFRGIQDSDIEIPSNWILSGTFEQSQVLSGLFDDFGIAVSSTETNFFDPNQDYEGILGGIFAPYRLVRYSLGGGLPQAVNAPANDKFDSDRSPLSSLNSIQLVITADKSKWSRCPVIETKDDGTSTHAKNQVKQKLSVDKEGNPVDTTGFGNLSLAVIDTLLDSDVETNAGFGSAVGMGWFPGYVINKETGERLNIAFGEDSRYSLNNGDDMIWNPTSTVAEGIDPQFINNIWGGKHFIYIFRKTLAEESAVIPARFSVPDYDEGAQLKELLGSNVATFRRFGWANCTWVGVPLLAPGQDLLSSDVTIDINVSKPYGIQESTLDSTLDNNGKPVYRFNTNGRATRKEQQATLNKEIERINVVPNPYYALSEYETSQLDNTVKFTNLPQNCTITIYNSNGTLIREYNKASPLTFLDWDLNNQVGIPISSGVYIIHVEVPGVGEKILKWFGVVRPVDLNNF